MTAGAHVTRGRSYLGKDLIGLESLNEPAAQAAEGGQRRPDPVVSAAEGPATVSTADVSSGNDEASTVSAAALDQTGTRSWQSARSHTTGFMPRCVMSTPCWPGRMPIK